MDKQFQAEVQITLKNYNLKDNGYWVWMTEGDSYEEAFANAIKEASEEKSDDEEIKSVTIYKVEENLDEHTEDYGIVHYNGQIITITQTPYVDGTTGKKPYYRALGISASKNEKEISEKIEWDIIWDVKDNWEEIDNDEDMCEWETPSWFRKL
jgi:hypothetical protein